MPILDYDRLPFRESAEEVLAIWRAGEYESLADAIQDCRALLHEVPGEHAAYTPMLEAILAEATALLAKISATGPGPAKALKAAAKSAKLAPTKTARGAEKSAAKKKVVAKKSPAKAKAKKAAKSPKRSAAKKTKKAPAKKAARSK